MLPDTTTAPPAAGKEIYPPRAALNWRTSSTPRDRAVWIRANILYEDEFSTTADPYEGYARWDSTNNDWVDRSGATIRREVRDCMTVLDWCELEERANNCPAEETSIAANVYHLDDEGRRETGTAGFFVLFRMWHPETGVDFVDVINGPFTLHVQACEALSRLISADHSTRLEMESRSRGVAEAIS
jgi:hypothetical protein